LLLEQDELLTSIDKDTVIKQEEFDFDNSDELNKIIGKYETKEREKSPDYDEIVNDLDLLE
jgi:hypothetical protein